MVFEDERPEELIDGKVVTMFPESTNHNRVRGNLYHVFGTYLHGKEPLPFGYWSYFYLTEKDHFSPDFSVVCDCDKVKEDGIYGAPDLAVEILSPSTMRNDRMYKKDVYARCGVREYWLVSPGDKSVEVYRNNGAELVFHNIYSLYPDWQLKRMSEEKRAEVETHFKCSLFDDLEISLNDIFYRTF